MYRSMYHSILEKFTTEKGLFFIMTAAILIVAVLILYLFFVYTAENVQVLTPNGGEEWGIGNIYEIKWKAKGIEKVGIVLFKGKKPELIAKDIPADFGKYEWEIYPGHEYGADFFVAVFEYPWREGNEIDYSDSAFAITFPELASCDNMSVEQEWPYLPSDLPNLRRVFITEESFTGNLDGLDGADQKCQEEAEKQGFDGKWQAFLGGDSDEDLAIERLKRTSRGTDGIFVTTWPAATLIRGATCHRLLGKNFDEFLAKLSALVIINEEELEENFLKDLENLWLGRVDEKSKKNCTTIAAVLSALNKPLAEKYSFTTTCQNWTQEKRVVEDYPVPRGEPKPSFPTCYTPAGKSTDAVALGGLASGLKGKGKDTAFTPYQGKYCSTRQKLLCIEE